MKRAKAQTLEWESVVLSLGQPRVKGRSASLRLGVWCCEIEKRGIYLGRVQRSRVNVMS